MRDAWKIELDRRAAEAICGSVKYITEEELDDRNDEFARTIRKVLTTQRAQELKRARRFINALIVALFVSLGLNWVQLALYVWK